MTISNLDKIFIEEALNCYDKIIISVPGVLFFLSFNF